MVGDYRDSSILLSIVLFEHFHNKMFNELKKIMEKAHGLQGSSWVLEETKCDLTDEQVPTGMIPFMH